VTNFALSQIPSEPWTEKIFRLLIAINIKNENDLPELRDTDDDWKGTESTLFWRFAQMTREEYIALYQKTLTEAIKAEINAPEKKETEPQEDDAGDFSECNVDMSEDADMGGDE